MYLLTKENFSILDKSKATDFVNYWSKHYQYKIKKYNSNDEIDYFSELNLNSNLSEDNLRNLLRWKDPKYLTEIIMSGPKKGEENERVRKVINEISSLNQFRNSSITESEFKNKSKYLFPGGVIWEIFIFHICKPLKYPIADQHVFRSYDLHTGCHKQISWEKYNEYKNYFQDIKDSYCQSIENLNGNIEIQKKIDNALFPFGQFLLKYNKVS